MASELAAAFLWAQLEQEEWITAQRLAVWARYHEGFAELEAAGRLRRPVVPVGVQHNAHMYYLLLPSGDDRDTVIDLQAAFGRSFDQGDFAKQINYDQDPATKLADENRDWLRQRLAEQQKR